jgi:hypothetical protein
VALKLSTRGTIRKIGLVLIFLNQFKEKPHAKSLRHEDDAEKNKKSYFAPATQFF